MSLPYSVIPTGHTGSAHSLPRHSQSSINLGPSGGSLPGSSRAQSAPPVGQIQSALPSTHSGFGTQFSSIPPSGEFIYWCIDIEETLAELIELDVRRLTDREFGRKLLSEYAAVKGWWYQFWTMTGCQGVFFKKVSGIPDNSLGFTCGNDSLMQFLYINDNQNLVYYRAGPAGLPDNPPYQYRKWTLPIDPVTHVSLLESKVNHMLKKHIDACWPWSKPIACCTSLTPYDLLEQIPKLGPNGLVAKEGHEGYGMRAVARLALWRIVTMLLIWQSGSICFLIYWLKRHPGDLQNGFMVLATTMMGFGLYLEILLRFRR